MKKAMLTKSGAYKIGRPELAGKIVLYNKIRETPEWIDGAYAESVFHDNKRIAGSLSFGEDPDLVAVED